MKVSVVHRQDIEAINEVFVNGKIHNLGELREFRKNEIIKNFLPNDCHVSLSWVRLRPDEKLDVHVHPVGSLIIVCEGNLQSLGETVAALEAGDILVVPAGCEHGFVGLAPEGFWGLSLQMEPQALYEDPDQPLVQFLKTNLSGGDKTNTSLETKNIDFHTFTQVTETNFCSFETLASKNKKLLEEFENNQLFRLAEAGHFQNIENRNTFLDRFQVWSDEFQRMVLARRVFSETSSFRALAEHHLSEEFGHNTQLKDSRAAESKPLLWDPILESSTQWFTFKMMTRSEAEAVALVHLVVEASATVFYKFMTPIFKQPQNPSSKQEANRAAHMEPSDHFKIHSFLDHDHADIGYEQLKRQGLEDYSSIALLTEQGWAMLNLAFGRIADLCKTKSAV